MYAQPVVKTIGTNGQSSLGKQYAGQQVLIEEQEAGVWLIRTADIIPHNERWVHEPEHKAKLQAALQWATQHGVSAANENEMLERLGTADTTVDEPQGAR